MYESMDVCIKDGIYPSHPIYAGKPVLPIFHKAMELVSTRWTIDPGERRYLVKWFLIRAIL
jgi:hypothetical protein